MKDIGLGRRDKSTSKIVFLNKKIRLTIIFLLSVRCNPLKTKVLAFKIISCFLVLFFFKWWSPSADDICGKGIFDDFYFR